MYHLDQSGISVLLVSGSESGLVDGDVKPASDADDYPSPQSCQYDPLFRWRDIVTFPIPLVRSGNMYDRPGPYLPRYSIVILDVFSMFDVIDF